MSNVIDESTDELTDASRELIESTLANKESANPMKPLTPKQIVAELDRYIVGQADAKRAVSIAIRKPLAASAAVR